ncbi:MAG: transketolase [Cypionkella sp.]
MTKQALDLLAIDTIRTLAIDAVQAADSGHPGAPMGLAAVGYTLWNRVMNFDPADPLWPNRDRFVLSNGHASMLLWALLNLAGTKAVGVDQKPTEADAVTMEDIRHFRQLGSKAEGHPEYRSTTGVETTTGPLGQGIATSVGMAIARKWLAARYTDATTTVFDYNIYAICGDGDMMEGVGAEAASMAGHLKLDDLCWIYDNNHVTIDGHTEITFTEDVAARFKAYGWHILHVKDANDTDAIEAALHGFQVTKGKPTLIIVDSHIGYGSPNLQDTSKAHGAPLGAEEVKLTKRAYDWPEDAQFLVPDGVRQHFADGLGKRGASANKHWHSTMRRFAARHPDLAREIDQMQAHELPSGWDNDLPNFPSDAKGIAGRDASSKVLNALAKNIPWLVGGSADLASSNKTRLTDPADGDFEPGNYAGRNIHFGIREHAMAAMNNGLTLSKLRSFASTFFVFTDYARPSMRMAAIMDLPNLWVFTHDALGDGEDGPTHQPVEHLMSLRAMPNMVVIRPGDANEVVEAYRYAMQMERSPCALVLTRQPLPTLDRTRFAPASGLAKGAYVLADCDSVTPDIILIATGSEVSLAVAAYENLQSRGVAARVVSMPSWELFEGQPEPYQQSVLPDAAQTRVAIEQGATLGWERYVGRRGTVIGMHSFGASAPLNQLAEYFGFTAEHVLKACDDVLAKAKK